MQDTTKQKQIFTILTWVFGLAGLVWIVGGFYSVYYRYLFPFIGLVNWGAAYLCRLKAKEL